MQERPPDPRRRPARGRRMVVAQVLQPVSPDSAGGESQVALSRSWPP